MYISLYLSFISKEEEKKELLNKEYKEEKDSIEGTINMRGTVEGFTEDLTLILGPEI